MNQYAKVISGTAFHCLSKEAMTPLIDCAIGIDDKGTIRSVTTPEHSDHSAILSHAREVGCLEHMPPDTYLIPGLVDLHIHAPQWPQLGKALDAPLEEWLLKYTFPLEAKFADISYARKVYDDLVATLLAHGTTTAVYFGSVDLAPNVVLAEACLKHGQRAIIGKVAMDHPETCPDYYRDDTPEQAISQTRAFIQELKDLQAGAPTLVHPAITPRFVPSCSDALLNGLGDLAQETGCHVQTHCAESDWEVAHVRERFGKTDAETLAQFGLMTDKTILAHSNFVTEDDMDSIAQHGSSVAHCPLSNTYFANAVFPARRALERGVKVGLGTDISGGFSPSLFEAARTALVVSRCACSGTNPDLPQEKRGTGEAPLTTTEVFWLATAGGAEACALPVGAFKVGLQFDALGVSACDSTSGFRVHSGDSPQDVFEKLVLTSNIGSISRVWVDGVQIDTEHSHKA